MRVNLLLAIILIGKCGIGAAAPTRYGLALAPVIGSFDGRGAAMIETQDTPGQGEYAIGTGLTALNLEIGGHVFTLTDDPAASVVLDHGKVTGINFSGQSAAGWLQCTSTRLAGATFFFKSRVRAAAGLITSAARGEAVTAIILSMHYAFLALTAAGLALAGGISRRKRVRFNSAAVAASASS